MILFGCFGKAIFLWSTLYEYIMQSLTNMYLPVTREEALEILCSSSRLSGLLYVL